MVFGKLIGGVLGLLVGGIVGLLIGGFIGHLFDRGLGNALKFASPANLERIKSSFFDTTFLLSGYLAKIDGRVSEEEISHAEQLFTQLGLSTEQRTRAIELFRRGSKPEFVLEEAVNDFLQNCGPQLQLQQTLLLFLISQAHADQTLDAAEREALENIARLLGMVPAQLERLLRMAQAQRQFHDGASGAGSTTVEDAYTALGVTADISDKDLKRAYRKLMSENHPDKLIAQGVPEDMIKLATERSQEIQSAYEMVRQKRGLRK